MGSARPRFRRLVVLVIKRAFDIIVSGVALVLLSPVLLTVTVAIKIGSPGPVLYRGIRVGREGRRFRILKFRTMVENAETLGASSTATDDPRITRVGVFLRAHKLDELPQFINVFIGDMSLVGPRPQVEWAVERYTSEERTILSVRPGITDFASIEFANEGELLRGSTDPDKDYLEKIHPQKMRLAIEYVRTRSLAVDCKILYLTAKAVLGEHPARR